LILPVFGLVANSPGGKFLVANSLRPARQQGTIGTTGV